MYEILTAREMREKFFNNELRTDLMCIEDYEKLFGHEMELDDPNGDVLSFCSNGLNQFDKYRMVAQKPPLEKIIHKRNLHLYRNRENEKNHKSKVLRVTRRVAVFVIVTVITVLLVQVVATAFGFDLFEYVYNWFKPETVEISKSETLHDGSFDLSTITIDEATSDNEPNSDGEIINEFILVYYEHPEDIDEEWLTRITPKLFEEYKFHSAYIYKIQDNEKFSIYFTDENGNFLSLIVQNEPLFYVEKEDGGSVEEIPLNGVTFLVFKNMEDYHVTWEYDEHFYKLNAFLTIETVMEIIHAYY